MKLENEDALDKFIICKQCYTLHEEICLKEGTKACCTVCHGVMYGVNGKLVSQGLALSITGLIFFIIANLFPLVKIDLLGYSQFITLSKTFIALFENEFYLVGILCFFLIFLFPLLIFLIHILFFSLLYLKKGSYLSKKLLILLTKMMPWSMSDIFLVSILIALVKLIGYADIEIGISFWSLMIFVLLDIFMTKSITLSELWMLRQHIFKYEKIL